MPGIYKKRVKSSRFALYSMYTGYVFYTYQSSVSVLEYIYSYITALSDQCDGLGTDRPLDMVIHCKNDSLTLSLVTLCIHALSDLNDVKV